MRGRHLHPARGGCGVLRPLRRPQMGQHWQGIRKFHGMYVADIFPSQERDQMAPDAVQYARALRPPYHLLSFLRLASFTNIIHVKSFAKPPSIPVTESVRYK